MAVLEDVLKTLFANRRKTLARSLRYETFAADRPCQLGIDHQRWHSACHLSCRPHLPLVDLAKVLPTLGLDPQARPEVLTNEQWSRLANFCQQQGWASPPVPSRSNASNV